MSFSWLKNAVEHTRFRRNPLHESKLNHPSWTVSAYAPIENAFEAIELFKEEVASEEEHDEGDWKKSVNTRIVKLRENLGENQAPWVEATLEHMQGLVLWTYREDLENIRHEILRRADGMSHGLLKERRQKSA